VRSTFRTFASLGKTVLAIQTNGHDMNDNELAMKRLAREREIARARVAEIEKSEALIRKLGHADIADAAASCLAQAREILTLIDRVTALGNDGQSLSANGLPCSTRAPGVARYNS
jgi:hypothetical protein